MAEAAKEPEKIIDPLSGEELSQKDIDNEINSRIDALQFATKEEIGQALKSSKGTTSTNFLKAFSSKEMPRLTAQEVRLIAATNGLTPPSVQINNLNKSGLFPNHNLEIEAETEQHSNTIINRVLCNTRIAISQKPVDETTKKLHEDLKSIQASLDPKDSLLTEFIIGQYLGMPLNHLALYTGMDETEMSQSIERINLKLAETKAHIHVRNGVAILGTKDGAITIFNNEEARKNLFPPKKENGKTANLETQLNTALAELSAEREKTTTAESKVADLTRRLLEAEDFALQADGKAEQAQSKATSLEAEKQILTTQLAQLELDIQEALRISAETAQGSGLEDLKKEKAKVETDLKKVEKKLEDKTAELTASREEARAARGEARIAKASEENLKKQLETAKRQAAEAEEARAAAMKARGRGALDMNAVADDRDTAKLKHDLTQAGQAIESLRGQLRKANEGVKIHPDELAKLRQASKDLQAANDRTADLGMDLKAKDRKIQQLEAQLTEKDQNTEELRATIAELNERNEQLNLLKLKLPESTTDTAALEQQLAQQLSTIEGLQNEIKRLNSEIAQLTDLLDSATDSSATSATKPIVKKKTTETASPTTFSEQITKIEKSSYNREDEIYDDVITALKFQSSSNSLTKQQIDLLQDTVTSINLGGDQLTHQHRIRIARLLKDLKKKGDEVQAENINSCIQELSNQSARNEINNAFQRSRKR